MYVSCSELFITSRRENVTLIAFSAGSIIIIELDYARFYMFTTAMRRAVIVFES